MESIRLGGPAHGIVTKAVHKTLPGGGEGPAGGWVGGFWGGGVVGVWGWWGSRGGWVGVVGSKGWWVSRSGWVGVVGSRGRVGRGWGHGGGRDQG